MDIGVWGLQSMGLQKSQVRLSNKTTEFSKHRIKNKIDVWIDVIEHNSSDIPWQGRNYMSNKKMTVNQGKKIKIFKKEKDGSNVYLLL